MRLTIAETSSRSRAAPLLLLPGIPGPLHLASALDKPVVGIFGPTDPARNGPFWGSFKVLRHPESRRDHARHAAPEAGLYSTITPEAVLDAAMELLKEAKVVQGGWSKNCEAHPRADGFCLRRALSLAGPAYTRAYCAKSDSRQSRALAARLCIRIRQKNMELTVTGPYAFTRNPLYLGSMLIAFGFALASRSIWIGALALAVLFAPHLHPGDPGSEEAFLAIEV